MPADEVGFPLDAIERRAQSLPLWLAFDRHGTKLTSLWGLDLFYGDIATRGIAVWNTNGKHLLTFEHRAASWFDVDRDGEFAVTADGDCLRVWRLAGRSDRLRLLRDQ
jgi:hypothetical protein